MAINFNTIQLAGTGSVITEELTSSATITISKIGGTHDNKTIPNPSGKITYLVIDVIGGGSTTVPGLGNANFTIRDTNGVKLHTAYSNTNFAYVLPRGTYSSGAVTIASDLPTIPANTLRIRAVGIKQDSTNMITIDGGGGSSFTGVIGTGVIGSTYRIGG